MEECVEIRTFSMECLGSGGNQLFITQTSRHTHLLLLNVKVLQS